MTVGLRKFTPAQWDWLLTLLAECYAPAARACSECPYWGNCYVRDNGCPVCDCFAYYGQSIRDRCAACGHLMLGCQRIDVDDRVDRLIERLEGEGIFDD